MIFPIYPDNFSLSSLVLAAPDGYVKRLEGSVGFLNIASLSGNNWMVSLSHTACIGMAQYNYRERCK